MKAWKDYIKTREQLIDQFGSDKKKRHWD